MKPELLRQLEAARASIAPRWDEERAAAARAGMARRARTHRRRRRATASGLVLLLTAGAFWLSARPRPDVEVTAVAAGTAWHEEPPTPSLRVFRLEEGSAWFQVSPRGARVVKVRCRGVEVEVVGTRFLVEGLAQGARVLVDHGRVRVRVEGGAARELRDGEEAVFSTALEVSAPLPGPPTAPAVPLAPAPAPRPRAQPPPPRPAADAGEGWRALAESGDFVGAWAAMQTAPPPADEPLELLLAADVARLSHHPEDAVRPLQRVIDAHGGDARAPLAAFTLGRVLLDELGRPREAAAAFAAVRRLEPSTALAEDSLAREVEAQDRAGERAQARELATEYQRRYPSGPRLRAVRHYGGLE